MHVAYHKTLNPKIVPTEEFHALLLTNEWFDRPQETLEGNSDERKRTIESGSRQENVETERVSVCGIRPGIAGHETDENGGTTQSGESNSREDVEKKKRGRPKSKLE